MAWSSSADASAGRAGPSSCTVLTEDGRGQGHELICNALAGQNIAGLSYGARQVLDQVITGEYPIALQIFNNHTVISASGGRGQLVAMNPATRHLAHPCRGHMRQPRIRMPASCWSRFFWCPRKARSFSATITPAHRSTVAAACHSTAAGRKIRSGGLFSRRRRSSIRCRNGRKFFKICFAEQEARLQKSRGRIAVFCGAIAAFAIVAHGSARAADRTLIDAAKKEGVVT